VEAGKSDGGPFGVSAGTTGGTIAGMTGFEVGVAWRIGAVASGDGKDTDVRRGSWS